MKNLTQIHKTSIQALWMVMITAVVTMFPELAFAQTDVFTTVESKLETGYDAFRKYVFIIGGAGALVLGIFAFFGTFKWMWFFALLGGLAVVGLLGEIIDFIVVDTQTGAELVTGGTTGN